MVKEKCEKMDVMCLKALIKKRTRYGDNKQAPPKR